MRCAGILLAVLVAGCATTGPISIDDPAAWTPHPADGVDLKLTDDGGALRLDFHFTGGGYAIARREVDLDLPADYVFTFRVRGEAPSENLEFKLIDTSGENVWWHVWHDVSWSKDWRVFHAKKRQIQFAWGPRGGGELHHVAAIEFAITAGSGGEGTVWIDDLQMTPVSPRTGPPPPVVATASSSQPDHGPALVLDEDAATAWEAAADDRAPTLTLDFGELREYGGLVIDWQDARYATNYVVEAQDGTEPWRTLTSVTASNGGRDYLALPESESRRLRIRMTGCTGGGCAIREITIEPVGWSITREAFMMAVARDQARGLYPRSFLGEPLSWTVVGQDFDTREGLLSEDGALESGPGGFSVEPFLLTADKLITWNDATVSQSLADGYLPIPSVTWRTGAWHLTVTALGVGEPEKSLILARYVVQNTDTAASSARLALAIRPLQVDPPSQTLNLAGGVAPIASIARQGRTIHVDGKPRLRLLRQPDAFGATTFAGGDIVADHLTDGEIPSAQEVDDPQRLASAAAVYDVTLAPGDSLAVSLLIPLHDAAPLSPIEPDSALQTAITDWTARLNRVSFEVPPDLEDALLTMKAQLGFILVNRAGPAIQPGARSYARSWIRDGALTSEALLRLGHADAVRDFLRWYAPYQYDSGKIPCVVDRRGADPVPEHDSTGEFIYLVAEYYRATHDQDVLVAMWPRVLKGIAYLESLLDERRTPPYEGTEFYGILPPSISHEGYSAKPMHSYWDDFWALRGYGDAADLAAALGDTAQQSRLVALRQRFAADLGASIAAAMQAHAIDYVPGCADLGDFDATSTTIALDPCEACDLLPPGSLEATFARYWDFFTARQGGAPWDAFTPYEIRTIGAFVHLGWDDRASELLRFFLAHRTPAGWRQWPEVVWHDRSTAHFVGDLPHTWVGSDFIRSFLTLLAAEDG